MNNSAAFPDLETVGKRRKALGISQVELARRIGISQSLLTKIERGVVVPSYTIAVALFGALEGMERKDNKSAREVMNEKFVVLKYNNTMEHAVEVAKKHSISQFPVTRDGKMIGSITTYDMIGADKGSSVSDYMKEPFPTVSEETPVSIVKDLLKLNWAVVVVKGARIAGIITTQDLLL